MFVPRRERLGKKNYLELTGTGHPAPARDISNGASVSDQIPRGRRLQALLHHAIEAAGLVLVSIDAVLDLLRRIP